MKLHASKIDQFPVKLIKFRHYIMDEPDMGDGTGRDRLVTLEFKNQAKNDFLIRQPNPHLSWNR